jgi:hypothetical protein
MERRALIVYCDNTHSGELSGPTSDFQNFTNYLQTKIGGEWQEDEITGLRNPTISEVRQAVNEFMIAADYTFTIFSGHGYIDSNDRQFMEVADGDISIAALRTLAPRQTLIVDACRGRHIPTDIAAEPKFFSDVLESIEEIGSTRALFDREVQRADEGFSILFSASPNEASDDSDHGGIYLVSLLKITEAWRETGHGEAILPINLAHTQAIDYLRENYVTSTQHPRMKPEKRRGHYPFAVKAIALRG